MFSAGPPPPSAAEIKIQVKEAKTAMKTAVATCLVLYLSPFAVEYVKRFV